MRTETIHYDDGETKAELTVKAATVLDGMRRTRLRTEARAQQDKLDVDTFLLRLFTFPDASSVTTGQINNRVITWEEPLTFAEVCGLPELLLIQVEDAVYRLNPHWLAKPKAEEAEENSKKASDTTPV